jgi:hypothetical protein
MAEHFVHVRVDPKTVKVMSFKGLAIPRVDDVMRLASPAQNIDGEWLVTDVKWVITNRAQGTTMYASEAQAEVWVKPAGGKWWWKPLRSVIFSALWVVLTCGVVATLFHLGVLP